MQPTTGGHPPHDSLPSIFDDIEAGRRVNNTPVPFTPRMPSPPLPPPSRSSSSENGCASVAGGGAVVALVLVIVVICAVLGVFNEPASVIAANATATANASVPAQPNYGFGPGYTPPPDPPTPTEVTTDNVLPGLDAQQVATMVLDYHDAQFPSITTPDHSVMTSVTRVAYAQDADGYPNNPNTDEVYYCFAYTYASAKTPNIVEGTTTGLTGIRFDDSTYSGPYILSDELPSDVTSNYCNTSGYDWVSIPPVRSYPPLSANLLPQQGSAYNAPYTSVTYSRQGGPYILACEYQDSDGSYTPYLLFYSQLNSKWEVFPGPLDNGYNPCY